MDAKALVDRCYAQNGLLAGTSETEFVGLRTGPMGHDPFSSGICDCDGGDCCSPGRTL